MLKAGLIDDVLDDRVNHFGETFVELFAIHSYTGACLLSLRNVELIEWKRKKGWPRIKTRDRYTCR
jgi:hypothetical protein